MALLASLALAATAPAPAPAAARPAAKAPAFALTPAGDHKPRRLSATPGATLRGAVTVRNVSRKPITVRLQRADIRNATNGNADFVTVGVSQTGRWLRLSATTIRLAPKTSRRVTYTVRVPKNARGASHYAGIVAVDAAEIAAAAPRKDAGASTKTGFRFSRINRQALPITIRLPGPLTRKLTLRSVKLVVEPAGAGLVLGLRPGGTVFTASAPVKLRVSRGTGTILRHSSTLGQLFPDDNFDFRIPWVGRPTEGDYLVRGVIRPKGAAPVYINQTVKFTPAKVKELPRETPPVAGEAAPEPSGLPSWVWLALAGGGGLLLALLLVILKLARRRPAPVA